MSRGPELTRRGFAGAVAASGAAAVLGCGDGAESRVPRDAASTGTPPAAARAMIVYRDPNCPCCEKWAKLAEDAGYRVRVVDHPDMPSLKRQHRVPEELASCHTAIVEGYAIEGHVPFAHLARLLGERTEGIIGLAVAGMPAGSPGMEMPDGTKDEFAVMAFDKNGRYTPFRA